MTFDVINQRFTGQAAKGINCNPCGMSFAIPESLYAQWDARERKVTCPNCARELHPVGETETERLRRQVQQEKDRHESTRAYLNSRVAAEKAAAHANAIRAGIAKATLKRAMHRIGAGVCPCCNRTFKQLARHMQAKHQEVAKR